MDERGLQHFGQGGVHIHHTSGSNAVHKQDRKSLQAESNNTVHLQPCCPAACSDWKSHSWREWRGIRLKTKSHHSSRGLNLHHKDNISTAVEVQIVTPSPDILRFHSEESRLYAEQLLVEIGSLKTRHLKLGLVVSKYFWIKIAIVNAMMLV